MTLLATLSETLPLRAPLLPTRTSLDAVLRVRVTQGDLDNWTAAAGSRGALSAWVRESLNVAQLDPGTPLEIVRILSAAQRDLNGLGNNLNQITKRLHGQDVPPTGTELAQIARELAVLGREVKRIRKTVRPPRRTSQG